MRNILFSFRFGNIKNTYFKHRPEFKILLRHYQLYIIIFCCSQEKIQFDFELLILQIYF